MNQPQDETAALAAYKLAIKQNPQVRDVFRWDSIEVEPRNDREIQVIVTAGFSHRNGWQAVIEAETIPRMWVEGAAHIPWLVEALEARVQAACRRDGLSPERRVHSRYWNDDPEGVTKS